LFRPQFCVQKFLIYLLQKQVCNISVHWCLVRIALSFLQAYSPYRATHRLGFGQCVYCPHQGCIRHGGQSVLPVVKCCCYSDFHSVTTFLNRSKSTGLNTKKHPIINIAVGYKMLNSQFYAVFVNCIQQNRPFYGAVKIMLFLLIGYY